MLFAPHRRTLRTSLILTAIVLLASGPAFAVDDDDWMLAAARPWIAKSLELTAEKKTAIVAAVAEYQSAIYGASRSYPRGGQDADGTRQQARIQTSIETARGNALKTVRDALSLDQQAKLAELVKLDVPSREVTFRVGYFTSLLQPPAIQPFGKEGILLTRGQSSKVRAWVLQAEEDWRNSNGDPDARLKQQQDRVEAQLLEILTDQQRQEWLPLRDQARANPSHQILVGPLRGLMEDASQAGFFAPRNQSLSRAEKMESANGLISQKYWQPADSNDEKLLLWHPENQFVASMQQSPDKRYLLTVGSSIPGAKSVTEMRLWDAKSGKLLDSLPTSNPAAVSIRFFTTESLQLVIEPYSR